MPPPQNDVYARLATILSPQLVAKKQQQQQQSSRSPGGAYLKRSGASTGSSPHGGGNPGSMRPAANLRWKNGFLAAGVGAIVIVGSLTGAQLKTDQQKKERIHKFREAAPEEQIRALEEQRSVLVQQRGMLERRLDGFKERAKERAEERQRRREKLASKP